MNVIPNNRSDRSQPKAASGKTTSAEIIGRAPAQSAASGEPAGIRRQWLKHYRNLLQLREALLSQCSTHATEARETSVNFSLHEADAGTDSFDRDFSLSLLSAEQDALYEVEAALRRIESGTYGVCELTGKPIPRARLAAIPWTRFSVATAKQLEQEHALAQTHFGSRGTVRETETPKKTETETE